MPKLKSLRGAVGSYGRVAAGGIVEVSEAEAEKLLKTKRFVRATDADIKAAQERQKAELAVQTAGATPGFSAMPGQPDTTDRLSRMVETGQISRDKAKELVALQINLSTEEVQEFIKAEGDRIFAEVSAAQADLDARELALTERENHLAAREADLEAREKASADHATAAGSRDDARAEGAGQADEAKKAPAKDKAAK